MIRRPPRSTQSRSSAASDVYKRQIPTLGTLSGEQAASGNLMPATTTAYLDIAEEIAQEHFQAHLDEFQKAGLPPPLKSLAAIRLRSSPGPLKKSMQT